MATATSSIDIAFVPQPNMVLLPIAAATHLYAGPLVGVNGAGNVVAAADVSGLTVIGRSEMEVDNSAGAAGDLSLLVRRGVFLLPNSLTDPVTIASLGQFAYIEDDHTVRAGGGTNNIRAGLVMGIDSTGKVMVDTTLVVHPSVSVADGAVTTVKIAAANVTLAKLAAGITPSHVVKYAGTATMAGGNATEAVTVAGLLATDIITAVIVENLANNTLQLLEAKPTANTLTLLFSADPTAGIKVSYTALRAAS
jgi:hypothetical protein